MKLYTLLIAILLLIVNIAYADISPDQAECRCTYFVEYMTGVRFPDYVSITDTRIHSGYPKKGDISLQWFPQASVYHLGIVASTTPVGFYLLSSNWGGCGISLHFINYLDTSYYGTWK